MALEILTEGEETNAAKFIIKDNKNLLSKIDFILWMLEFAYVTSIGIFQVSSILTLIFLILLILYKRNQVKEGITSSTLSHYLKFCFFLMTLSLESLTFFDGIGVQISHKTFAGSESNLFIDKSKIKSIVIHEYVQFQSIRYYLTLIPHSPQSKLTIAYQVTLSCILTIISYVLPQFLF